MPDITDPAWWETSQEKSFKVVRASDLPNLLPKDWKVRVKDYIERLAKREFKDPNP